MKFADKIFKGKAYYVTSKYGKRAQINTSAGTTASFHYGTDYGTNGEAWAQYAIEDGYVFAAAKASDGALYVWVVYPRIKKALLHYHLKSYAVKAGQTVKEGTKLGETGMTGKATGVHLHLGCRNLEQLTASQIKSMTWTLLRNCPYIDPDAYNYTQEPVEQSTSSVKIQAALHKSNAVAGTYKATANVHIRAGAGTDKTSLGIVKKGYKVKCYGYYNTVDGKKWLYVASGSKVGYIHSDYLQKV